MFYKKKQTPLKGAKFPASTKVVYCLFVQLQWILATSKGPVFLDQAQRLLGLIWVQNFCKDYKAEYASRLKIYSFI